MGKIHIFAIFISLILLAANASAFSISSETSSKSICIGSTATISTLVEGKGSFTVTQEGSASAFSMTVPPEFEIDGAQNVYSYVTPSSRIAAGDYELKVRVAGEGETKEQKYAINVKDCPKSEFRVESRKITCPCQKASFILSLANNADYAETYSLSAEGTLKEWMSLSEKSITLQPNEEKDITASIDAPCNVHGQYALSFKAKPSRYFSSLTAKSVLDIQPCYEYSLSFRNAEYSMCENDVLSVPLALLNEGTADNLFKISIDGPKWVSYDDKTQLKSGDERMLNITLSPPYGTSGNFTIKVDVLSEYGNVNKKAEMKAKVDHCYGLSAYFSSKEEAICDPGREYSYAFMIKNSGRFDELINLSLEGPEWATFGKSSLALKANESMEIRLNAKLPSNAEAGIYRIKAKASGKVSEAEDSITVKVATLEECYSPALSLQEDSVSIEREESKILTAELKNNGIDESTFIIGLDGDAASFSTVNPGIVKLKPGKSEKLYIYISPQIFAEEKDYALNISARVKDTKIASSENIKIKVIEQEEEKEGAKGENETAKQGFFSRIFSKIKSFFSEIFSSGKSEKPKSESLNFSDITIPPKTVLEAQNQSEVKKEKETVMIIGSITDLSGSKQAGNVSESNESENQEESGELEEANFSSTLNWENAKKSLLNFSAYKSYLLGAISVILIIIIFATGFWKKIIDFFDEEEELEEKVKEKK